MNYPKEWIDVGLKLKAMKLPERRANMSYEEMYPERIKLMADYKKRLMTTGLTFREKMEFRMTIARWMVDRVRDSA